MFAALELLARANHGVFTKRQAVAAGVPGHRLSRLARTGVIARLSQGVYAVSQVPAQLVAPWVVTRAHRVVLSYWSAAAWWGVDLPAALAAVHVTAPRSRGCRSDAISGVRLHRADLGGTEVQLVRGVMVTTPLRTCLDIARHAPLEEAVAIVDAFLRARLITHDEFDGAARQAIGPGRARLQTVAALVDADSGSVLESLVRVLLWRNGMCAPTSQHFLAHPPSRWKGFLDFAWPELKVALECDGYEWHAAREPFQKDRRRWSALNRMSWRLGVVTWFDVTQDPAYVVALVADLLGRPVPRPIRHTNVAWGAAVA